MNLLSKLKLPSPLQATPVQRVARRIYLILAVIFAAGLVLMVYIAGLGVLVDPHHFDAHRLLSSPLMLLLLIMLAAGLVGRIGFFPLLLTGLTLFVFTFQFPFIYAFDGGGRALHVANALMLFWLAIALMRKGWVLLTETIRGTPGPAAASLRGIGVFALSLLPVGAYALLVPDRSLHAAQLASDATGAEIYAAACASCHGPDGSGGLGPALAGNDALAVTAHVTAVITEGQGTMPAQDMLSPVHVDTVTRYIQSAWGNDYLTD